MIQLSPIDTAIILLYFSVIIFIGFRAARKKTDSEVDFLLAGRSLSLPIFVMTLVSTWYGGILGVGEFSYRYGISNWVIQGVPYYVFAAIFASLLAKKIRATGLISIPDKLQAAYDTKTALLGSLLTFILTTPAPYLLMLSIFLQMLFGWSLIVCLIVAAVVTLSYLFLGGFRSDVHTDIAEFILMFSGFAVILPFCFIRLGGWEFLQATLPPLHLTWHGGNTTQYILVWFFIALWTLVDPAFHQRCYAAKDGKTAQRGIFWSIGFWCIFDFMTATAGLYVRAIYPELDQPVKAYPMLAEAILPPVAKGMFYVGMLATIMSTLNSLAFISAQSLGRDIYGRARGHKGQAAGETKRFIRWGLVGSFALSVVISLAIPSVVQIWYTIGTVVVPGLLIPLMASYFHSLRIPARFAFWSMLLAWTTSLGWLLAGQLGVETGNYPLDVEPMYPGLAIGILLWSFGRIAQTREMRGGEKNNKG